MPLLAGGVAVTLRSVLTLMAVHAHPDDEASSTGGVLARYASEGVRMVVVTCTDGELGDAPDGSKPGRPGHDAAVAAEQRRTELRRSCERLRGRTEEIPGEAAGDTEEVPAGTLHDLPSDFGTPEEEISASIDCSAFVEARFAVLGAHASQQDNAVFLRLGIERFTTMFSTECLVRAFDTTGAAVPEPDLFAGLRDPTPAVG